MKKYENISKFNRVGYDIKSIHKHTSSLPEDYDQLIELILRHEGIWGSDVSIVESAKDLPENARQEYNKGIIESDGLAQLSMFFKPDDTVYLISDLIGNLARKINVDDSDFIFKTGLHSIVVHKCLRHIIELNSEDYKSSMVNLYTAIGEDKILEYEITGGIKIRQAFEYQINAPGGVLSPDDKVFLADTYIGYMSKNLARNKTKMQKLTGKMWRYVSSLLNLRLTDAELEGLIRSALEHRRSTTMS